MVPQLLNTAHVRGAEGSVAHQLHPFSTFSSRKFEVSVMNLF